jgi:cysteine synthase
MRLLGAQVIPVKSGTATLKDAVSEAMREWTSRISDTHYCLGSVMGPHPFPTIVRDFQAVISKEIKEQMLQKEGRLPDAVIACVGGGSNAIGSFYHFIGDETVRLIGCEAAGRGVDTFETAATIATGKLGIFHGMKSYFCQDEYGQIAPVYSISAGLDYPGVGPEHAHLHDIGRAEYVPITDEEAVCAFEYLAKTEGIIPAIESAHAVAHAIKLAPTMDRDKIIVITTRERAYVKEPEKALALHEKVWLLRCGSLGEEHPFALTSLSNMAFSCEDLGDYARALELNEKLYALRYRSLGERHPDTLLALGELSRLCGRVGEYQKAVQLGERVYQLRREVLSEEHPDTVASLGSLALAYSDLGENEKALVLMEKAYMLHCKVLGQSHPATAVAAQFLDFLRQTAEVKQ